MSDVPTLYEWAGGRAAIERMINCFYDRVERDDLLSPFFPGGVSATHREHVTTWWCEVLGGPADDTELPADPEFRAAPCARARRRGLSPPPPPGSPPPPPWIRPATSYAAGSA